jgi:hypothetical protein
MAMLENVDEGFAVVRDMLDEAAVLREEGVLPVDRAARNEDGERGSRDDEKERSF